MKVLFITRHGASNYGSLLQTIATQYILKQMGHDCKIIDYIRDDEFGANSTFTIAKSTPKWNSNLLIYALYIIVRYPENYIVSKKFKRMRNKYLQMTQRYHSLQELKNNKPDADIYMTGSDQVWGKVLNGGYDWAYFLDFCDEKDKKIAFASSFGKTYVDSKDEEKMISLLSKYNALGVRESHAVSMLKNWGIKSDHVLDPTLLLTADEWRNLLGLKKGNKKSDYVLVYQIHSNDELGKYALEFSKQVGLPLIRVSSTLHQFNKGGKFIPVPEISEFISYLENASWIITDSFHGTVFAANFNVPFIDIMPKTGTSSRIESILKLTNLTTQVVDDLNDFSIKDREVDFTFANKVLKNEREKSIRILEQMLNNI